MPTELFLAWRYFRPKRNAVSVITLISIIGVGLGVGVLIVVLAVMTGFTDRMKDKLLDTTAHAQIYSRGVPFIKHPEPVFESAGTLFPGEDPFVFVRDGRLYTLLKDMGRNYSESERGLVLFDSEDGIKWRPHSPALALTRRLKWEGGSEQEFHRLERPQLLLDGDRAFFMGAAMPDAGKDESFNIQFEVELDF